jgi:hypothetical protein
VTADAILVVTWLVTAHLVGDFVLQTDGVAADKVGHGRRAVRGLALHVAAVFACLLPFALAFGLPGLVAALAITAAHAGIDRAKVVLTRGAEARALGAARTSHEEPAPEASLGTAWTPVPAALFALDQLAHGVVIGVAWLTLLSAAPLTASFVSAVEAVVGHLDPAAVHRGVLVVLVLVDLAIVNVRAASFFVATLVHPREVVTGSDRRAVPGDDDERTPTTTRGSWTLRLGRLRATAESTSVAVPAPVESPREVSPARVGATIGVLERLLIVAFMMTGAQAAVGFVVAAKTIARFRQLDDRRFAEYYLLGTLASVSVALGSALIADATLAAVP